MQRIRLCRSKGDKIEFSEMEDSPTLGLEAEDLYLIQHIHSQAHNLSK